MAAFSEILVTMVDQVSFAFDAWSRASFAAPTQFPARKAIRTASVAKGSNSLRDRADATTDPAIKPVQRPTTLVLAGLGTSDGFSPK